MDPTAGMLFLCVIVLAGLGLLLAPKPKPPRRPDAEYWEFRNDRR